MNQIENFIVSKGVKVCPSCGAEPWMVDKGKRTRPRLCDCGDKLIPRSDLPRTHHRDKTKE